MKSPIIAILLISISCSISAQESKERKGNDNVSLPEFLDPLYLGMPFNKFMKKKKRKKLDYSNIIVFRAEYVERNVNSIVNEITYYIDQDGKKPLYEFIIEFNDTIDVNNYALDKYGEPNYGKEWRFVRDNDFDVWIWTFQNKLVIVGVIEGTEWDGEE